MENAKTSENLHVTKPKLSRKKALLLTIVKKVRLQ